MLWAMCPGHDENLKGLELVGQSGDLLWRTISPLGLNRDTFDVQNVVRCQPTDERGGNRDPSKRELLCCSVYNDEALKLNQCEAAVHVILGDVAGAQLLGKNFNKEHPVFWYEPWDAYVVLNYHPSYILRKGGERAGGEYYSWRDRFRAVRAAIDFPGRWGYVNSRNYKTVRTLSEFDAMEKFLRSEADQKRRVSFDIEDGTVDGRRVILMAGFGTGHYQYKGERGEASDWSRWTGQCYSVVLDHPDNHDRTHADEMKVRVKRLIEDGEIKKALQYGSYDKHICKTYLNANLRGYDYDTQYGTYLRYSFLRSCSLENLTYRFFPEFADYKDTVKEWNGNFADAPIERLVLRNSGDCDITKRLEERFAPQVRYPLVQVYINAAQTLNGMENRGLLLDWENWRKAEDAVPKMVEKLDRVLQHISGDPNFDCDSPKQVAELVYDTLKLPQTEAGRSTQKTVLELLMAETGNQTLEIISKRRAIGKIKSTYLNAYATSAKMHGGELRTRFFLTGAVTGRLRSGGDGVPGYINAQNIHGNPLLQNLLVSDLDWRNALKNDYDDNLYVILAADGSQIEVRQLAELSGDKLLISQFKSGQDVHCLVGNALTGWSVERIKMEKNLRKMVKNMHFGIIFGLGRDSLYPYVVAKIRAIDGKNADLTGITPERLGRLFDKYFKVYKGVAAYIQKQRDNAERLGYVETLFGFRRDIRKDDDSRSSYWGNQAINTPVQGTAHEFLLIALALLNLKPRTYNLLQKCIIEVHDALYFLVKLRDLPEARRQLMDLFENGAYEYAQKKFNLKLHVPLTAESTAGFCMGSMVDYGGESVEEFLTAWRAKQLAIEAKSWEDLMPSSIV